ncbi:MAG: MFS transporter [Promethearchaeota archaeon]
MTYPFQYRQMKDRLRFFQLLFSSSINNMAGGLLLGFLSMYLVTYMTNPTDEGGLDLGDHIYSFALGLSVIVYMLSSVIAGAISDDLRGRYGNRIPFIVGGGAAMILILVLGYFVLKNNADLWFLVIILLIFISLARGTIATPFEALMSELFEKDQRGWAALARTMFSGLGTGIAVFTFPPLKDEGRFPEMLLIIAAAYLVSIILTGVLLPKINPDFPPDETLSDILATPQLLLEFGRGEFGKMLICQIFWSLGTGTINYFWVPYADKVLGANVEEAFGILITIGIVGAIFMIPIGFIVARLGKIITGALSSILFIGFIFFVMMANDINDLYLAAPLGGVAIIGLSTVTKSLPADLVPEGKEAQFFGINSLFTMLPDPITFGIAGLILGGVFVKSKAAQFNLLFSVAIIEIALATVFLLWIEYEDWVKDEYENFYTRFLRAKNKLPDRTWAGVTFKEYYGRKLKKSEEYQAEETSEINVRKITKSSIKNKTKEW